MALSYTPGWYPDPADPANLRYWDGSAWTAHVQPRNTAPQQPQAQQPQAQQPQRGGVDPNTGLPTDGGWGSGFAANGAAGAAGNSGFGGSAGAGYTQPSAPTPPTAPTGGSGLYGYDPAFGSGGGNSAGGYHQTAGHQDLLAGSDGPIESVMAMYKHWQDFRTRSSRSQYWWGWLLGYTVPTTILGFFLGIVGLIGGVVGAAVAAVLALPYFFLLIANLSLAARRIRDTGRSPSILLIPLVGIGAYAATLFYVTSATSSPGGVPAAAVVFMLVAYGVVALSSGWILAVLCAPSAQTTRPQAA